MIKMDYNATFNLGQRQRSDSSESTKSFERTKLIHGTENLSDSQAVGNFQETSHCQRNWRKSFLRRWRCQIVSHCIERTRWS